MSLLDDYRAQVQDYKKAGSIGAGLLADRPDLSLGKGGLLSLMQSAESKYMERVSNPLAYYRQHPEAQGLLSVSPELDLLDMATGGGKATFIGQMAKTFNKKALELAKDMSSKGATRDEIWTATGKLNAPTYKDVDGHWKQEISDEGYQYIEPESLNNSIGGVPQSATAELNFIRSASDGDLAQLADLVGFDGSPSEYQTEAIRNIYESMNDITRGKFLSGEVNKHPGLSAAYPDLDLGTIKYSKTVGFSDGNLGSFSPSTGESNLKLGADGMRSTMAHERQHHIQELEGFAKGGDASSFEKKRSVYDNNINYLEAVRTDAILAARKTPEWQGYQDGLMKALESGDKIDQMKFHNARTQLEKSATNDVDQELMQLYEKTKIKPYDQYLSLAGEAEARNVQTRLPMSMGERVAKAPWETLDVPERGLLVRGSTRPTKGLLGN